MLTDAVGGACALTCNRYKLTGVYQIDVGMGVGDWYIPYAHQQARYCDVPHGEPDGTLVVTFPMNGCALEVHAGINGNRFYHDADGNSMPNNLGMPKLRVAYADYAGPDNTTHERALRYFGNPDLPNAGGYEHNIICVKRGGDWEVYSSAVIRLNGDAWQVKDRVPYQVGVFADI